MKRREFVRNLLNIGAGAACGLCGVNPFKSRMRFAFAQGSGRALVVIFQRGGCDGLNEVIPTGDSIYYSSGFRPTLAIPRSQALLLGTFGNMEYGLHPSLAGLKTLFDAGNLAVLPACHHPGASRSHFEGEYDIESGQRDAPGSADGWLNRYMGRAPLTSQLRAVGWSSGLPQSLRGRTIVSAFTNITNFDLGLPNQADETELLADLRATYGQNADSSKLNRDLVQATGRVMVDNLGALAQVVNQQYTPSNGAVYPNTTLGRQMMQTAQILKANLGLEVAALQIGGWDTHDNQGGVTGAQADRFRQLGDSIGAFHRDMGTLMSNVVVLTMTEFGRTARENGSQGTDHGHATAWFVTGGTVQSTVHGNWPGLANNQMVSGRYLQHNVDYRDVMATVLSKHLGFTNFASFFPGYTPNQNLSFMT